MRSGPRPVADPAGDNDGVGTGRDSSLDGEFDRALVVGDEVGGHPCGFQGVPVRRKGIGDDHLGARRDVVAVHLADHVRVTQRRPTVPGAVQLWNAAPLALGASRTVDEHQLTGLDP